MNKLLIRFSDFLRSFRLLLSSIVFITIIGLVFGSLSQGQDVLLMAAESKTCASVIILAVSFFAFINWYTSRMIVRIKAEKNHQQYAAGERPSEFWFDVFPRILGYASFFAVEAAIINNPYFNNTEHDAVWILGLLVVQIVICIIVYRRLKGRVFKERSIWLFPAVLAVAIITSFLVPDNDDVHRRLIILLVLLWVVQTAFLIWNFVRRQRISYMEDNKEWAFKIGRLKLARMPESERSFFLLFTFFSAMAFVFYIIAIWRIDWARLVGPFNIAILSFSILVGFFQSVSMASIWNRINIHFILLIIMVVGGFFYSPYELRRHEEGGKVYNQRPGLTEHTKNWINARQAAIAATDTFPVYFVLSDGGASRSGYWVAGALGKLETATGHKFSEHLFCLSGASGGSVGNAVFYALLDSAARNSDFGQINYDSAAKTFLKNDFLSYTLSHLLGPDYFRHILYLGLTPDRGAALEESMENPADDNFFGYLFSRRYSEYANNFKNNPGKLPLFFINTTRVKDGMPGVVSNIKINTISRRLDVLNLIDTGDNRLPWGDINYSSAVCLSARFPYISPAADIDNRQYFVDGGYFDNSGAGIVMETIAALQEILKDSYYDSVRNKLVFHIVHMSNSDGTPTQPGRMHPLVNDLFTPLLTLAGSYSQQTNTNNDRLKEFVGVYANSNCTNCWTRINLYDALDKLKDKNSFSMNWVISDTTRARMDILLQDNEHLNQLIDRIKEQ